MNRWDWLRLATAALENALTYLSRGWWSEARQATAYAARCLDHV